jgi:hypothetical protein
MLSLGEDILITLLVSGGALAFTLVLNRLWPAQRRRMHEEQVGWQLNILGTTYAVILGFMLYTEWSNFTAAKLNVDLEANALRNVFRLASGLPAPQAAQLEAQARAYVAAALTKDWPDMWAGRLPEATHAINQSMWRTLMSLQGLSTAETLAADHALSELSALTQHRRTRLLHSSSQLPTIFWWLLLVGGFLTIVAVSMFGSLNLRVHTFQVGSLTLLVTRKRGGARFGRAVRRRSSPGSGAKGGAQRRAPGRRSRPLGGSADSARRSRRASSRARARSSAGRRA